MKGIPDVKYPDARKAVLVADNLNIHAAASFYEAFSPEEAFRLPQRLEIHCTPKHGSWLNTAEIELSALAARRRLNRRISGLNPARREVSAWQKDRNNRISRIKWQFTTSDARIKLRRLYLSV
jgi:hypothetical protein